MTGMLTESLVPLAEAGCHVPQHPHRSTLRRWACEGIDGVVLETLKIGGRRFTSLEAIDRFVQRLTTCGRQPQ